MTEQFTRLEVPAGLASLLDGSRQSRVREQWIHVNPGWWNTAIAKRELPGGSLQVSRDDQGRPGISRAALFDLAADDSDEGVLRLLWHALAWGGGRRARLMNKRLNSVAADLDSSVVALREAGTRAHTDPAAAYERLNPGGKTLIKYLGPAFFTKFLYFAGGGDPKHPSLILDRVTAESLRSYGWTGLRSTGWSASTYAHYCELLARWGVEVGNKIEREVAGDEIERWLFQPSG